MSSDQPLPSPEEIQKKLSEFMKQEFGDRVVFASPQTETVETTPPAGNRNASRLNSISISNPKKSKRTSTGL